MQTIVGVLRGGPSREHESSLRSGASILAHLPDERYVTRDIYINKNGEWHDRGRIISPERALRQIDVALIGLHGEYGENGEIQKLLQRYGVPYAGADAFGSYLAKHKLMSKTRAQEAGLLTPAFRYIDSASVAETMVHDIIRELSQPVVVKPVGWGSSLGVSIVGGYAHVLAAIENLFAQNAQGVLVEEYIRGKEATVSVVEGLRGEKLYVPPPVEIVLPKGEFFSHTLKTSGGIRLRFPGNFTRAASEELQRAARVAHRSLGLRHYSRSDFIVTPKGVYYLETNTLPEIHPESLLAKSLESVGIKFHYFLEHLIKLALGK